MVAQYAKRRQRDTIVSDSDFEGIIKPHLEAVLKTEFEKFEEEFAGLGDNERRKSKKSLNIKRGQMKQHLSGVNRPPFAVILKEICDEIKSKISESDVKRFKDNRDNLVHSGIFCVTNVEHLKALKADERDEIYSTKANERGAELKFMEDFVGKLILAALGCPQDLAGRKVRE